MSAVCKPIVAGFLVLLCTGVPGRADEIILNGRPCNTFCQQWMGVKPAGQALGEATAPTRPATARPPAIDPTNKVAVGRLQAPAVRPSVPDTPVARDQATLTPSAPPAQATTGPEALPQTDEDRAGPPDPRSLVSVRGVVMVETSEEKAFNRDQRQRLMNEVTKRNPGVGDVQD